MGARTAAADITHAVPAAAIRQQYRTLALLVALSTAFHLLLLLHLNPSRWERLRLPGSRGAADPESE